MSSARYRRSSFTFSSGTPSSPTSRWPRRGVFSQNAVRWKVHIADRESKSWPSSTKGISPRVHSLSFSSGKRSGSNRRSNSLPSHGPPNFRLRSTRTRFISTSTHSGSVMLNKPFDNQGASRRSASLPNGPVRPSLPTTRPRVVGDPDWFGNSRPTPSRRDVYRLCADSSVADTCRDATDCGDKIKRVGRHYTHFELATLGSITLTHKQKHFLHCRMRKCAQNIFNWFETAEGGLDFLILAFFLSSGAALFAQDRPVAPEGALVATEETPEAATNAEELRKRSAEPHNLIGVPIQENLNFDTGPADRAQECIEPPTGDSIQRVEKLERHHPLDYADHLPTTSRGAAAGAPGATDGSLRFGEI